MTGSIVIIGAGEAGARTAIALRENGFAGEVTVVGDEAYPPYERPPLSKETMTTGTEPALHLILPEEKGAALDVRLLCEVAATNIDRCAHVVVLADGRKIHYDRLLIATGAEARRLVIGSAEHNVVLYLRRFSDALALRSRLSRGSQLVVIGGGFIGLEIAASARSRGCEVTLLELAPRLLSRVVPSEIAAIIAARHEAAGVRLLKEVRLTGIEGGAGRRVVILSDGARIEADAVIAGIGAVPAVRLAERAGLAVENGIAVNAMLCTGDPDIFAAGDCCSFPHPLYGNRRIRLESSRNAQDQATVAARNLLGANEPYAAVPWFWSDQYDLTLQIAGLVDEGHEMIVRELAGDARLYFHLAFDGRLVAVGGIGPNAIIARDVKIAQMMIGRRAYPTRSALAAPYVRLRTLLAESTVACSRGACKETQ